MDVTHDALLQAAERFEQKGRQREAVTCRDMAAKLRHYGSFKTEKQSNYAAQLVSWSLPTTPTPDPIKRPAAADLAGTLGVLRVARMFGIAKSKGLTKARIDIAVSLPGDSIVPLVMKPVRANGRNPEGTIYVTCGATEDYLGKIMPDGQFFQSHRCGDDELQALKMFAQDPVGVSRSSGRLTSNCCFCRKKLSTSESVAVRYGRTCARNFGLPWGDEKVNTIFDLETQ